MLELLSRDRTVVRMNKIAFCVCLRRNGNSTINRFPELHPQLSKRLRQEVDQGEAIARVSVDIKWCFVAQGYPSLCSPMDCRPPDFSALGILQARILEWVTVPSSSRGSSQLRN